jgi:tetrapyrrole methylase family protein/MazG family protein
MRHPTSSGGTQHCGDVLKNWEDIKAAEKGIPSTSHPESERSLLDGIPSKLPALHRAYQMTAKASRVGFDWSHLEDILSKIREEASELMEAHSKQDSRKMMAETFLW